MGRLQDFQKAQGLSDEGVADLLSQRLGEPVDVEQVAKAKARGDKRLPKSYVRALELPEEPTGRAYRTGDGDLSPEPGEKNPIVKEKVKAPVPGVDELDWRNAREAVIAIYVSIGKGVSMITKKPHIAQVFAQGAPVLADDWIRLARVDERTRAVLAKLTVAGPGGQLAMDHIILVGKLISLEGGARGRVIVPDAETLANATAAAGHGANGAMDDAGIASAA